jgi:LPXTG-motif cell wall-anchored protein
MKYIDEAFNTGKTISWILSFLVLGTLIFGIWLDRRKKKNVA